MLPKPTRTARECYRLCVGRLKNSDQKQRLSAIEDEIARASEDYELAACSASLHTLPPSETVSGIVSGREMIEVYNRRMAKKGAPARLIYDELLAAPAHGRCPLCGQRTVSTLDHQLNKASYPALAVSPVNLVPACWDCNRAKMSRAPRSRCEETLHPYFDNIDDNRWLSAEILESNPIVIRFFVYPPSNWDPVTAARVRNHFRTFRLSSLYSAQAADEIANVRFQLSILFDRAGSGAVRTHLMERAESCEAARKNSWQTATYAALARNEWFCSLGFR